MAFNVSPLYPHLRRILLNVSKSSSYSHKGTATATISSDNPGTSNQYTKNGASEFDQKQKSCEYKQNKKKKTSEEEKTEARLKLLDLV